MSGQEDRGRRPDSPWRGDRSPADDDLLESGRRRMPGAAWRPPRIAVLLGAAGLVAGLAAGYTAGARHAGKSVPAPSRAPSSAAPSAAVGDLPLIQSGPQCSAHIGHDLQLGMQVTNTSATGVMLRRVRVVLPLGGLRAISQGWGTCGELPAFGQEPGNILPAGASIWFTVTFRVLLRCPRPLPVQFTIDYEQQGRAAAIHLPGFSDLGQVPYGTCA